MKTSSSKNDRLRILFLTIDESATLVNLKNYISKETDVELDYMLFGLPRSKNSKTIQNIYFVISSGKNIDKSKSFNISFKEPLCSLFKFVMHCYAFFILLKIIKNNKYDICIAETSTLGMMAWILKKIGKCKMTIFFAGDIYPTQLEGIVGFLLEFSQKLMRKISYRNNIIWFINKRLKKWDEKRGFIPQDFFINGIYVFDEKRVNRHLKRIKNMNQICYLGRMDHYSGLDVSIRSLKYIQKKIPDISLVVVGGYSDKDLLYYQELVEKEKVSGRVKFKGYIPKMEQVETILAQSALGMAIYSLDERNGVLYSDPGKVRNYLTCQTPVVITKNGPQVAKEIEKYKAGILVAYEPRDVAQKIIQVLASKEKYKILRLGVMRFTKDRSYQKVMPKVFRKILNYYTKYKFLD